MSLPDRGICHHDIFYDICRDATKGITIEEFRKRHTETYNLDYYFPRAVQLGLLEEKLDIFRITSRGRAYIESYEHTSSFFEKPESRIEI